MNELATELSTLIRTLAFAGRAAADEWVKTSGLSRQQAFTLGYIERFQDTGIIARDLAEFSGTTAASVTSLLKGLEARGLIQRHSSPEDSRVKLITATEAGAAAVAGFEGDMLRANDALYAVLEPEEQEQLAALLRRVAAEAPQVDDFPDGEGPGPGPRRR